MNTAQNMNVLNNLLKFNLVTLFILCCIYADAHNLCNNNLVPTNNKLKNILINSNGIERSFLVYTPSNYNPAAGNIVLFMFHGTSQDGLKMFNKTKWHLKAEQANFLVVYPNSLCYYLLDEGAIKSRWNDGNLKLLPNVTAANDVIFFNDIIDWLQEYRDSLNTQGTTLLPTKNYICGFSNGAMFCSRLLMDAADKITAATMVSTILPNATNSSPANPVPCLIIYGSKDQRILDTLNIISQNQFPPSPSKFYAVPLFKNLINWHTNRNQLSNNYTSQTTNDKYKLVFSQPLNQQIDYRKYLEIQLYKGLPHIYPMNNDVNATKLFWIFFSNY